VASELGCEAARVVRLAAFPTNAVYEVHADERRFIVKASTLHDALRAEAWACARAAHAGLAVPAVLGRGRVRTDRGLSAFIMDRVAGGPITADHPALRELGAGLRRLHDVKLPGFGWLAEASWDERGPVSLPHGSWTGFLNSLTGDARRLGSVIAAPVADAAAAAMDVHAEALAAVEVGALCHGDLKPAHVRVEGGRLTGMIDWGDAVVGDPLWDIARFAHRTDARSLASLLEGYEPDPAMVLQLPSLVSLYGTLWMLADAIVDHRLGRRVEPALEAAWDFLARQAGGAASGP
jgi:aminoglycoside phosphotransferase (APT) family kinase protein